MGQISNIIFKRIPFSQSRYYYYYYDGLDARVRLTEQTAINNGRAVGIKIHHRFSDYVSWAIGSNGDMDLSRTLNSDVIREGGRSPDNIVISSRELVRKSFKDIENGRWAHIKIF